MDITLRKTNIIEDIRKKSHLNVKSVENIDLRYDIEVGTDKDYELLRCVSSTMSALIQVVSRWLMPEWMNSSDDEVVSRDQFVFSISNRRVANKAEALATAMHDYVVYGSMAAFYVSVSQVELSNVYLTKASSCEQLIRMLLNSKIPPRR